MTRSYSVPAVITVTTRNRFSGALSEKSYTYTASAGWKSDPISTMPVVRGDTTYFCKPTGYTAEGEENLCGVAYSSRVGEWYFKPPSVTKSKNGWYHSMVTHNLSNLSNIINRAIVAAGDSQAGFGESIAEMKSTVGMVGEFGNRADAIASAVNRGSRIDAFKAVGLLLPQGKSKRFPRTKSVADSYLELQFGWMPLINDVYTAVKLLHTGFKSREKGQIVVGLARESEEDVDTQSNYSDPYCGTYPSAVTRRMNRHCKMVYYVDNESPLYTLNQLGLANPLRTAWDMSRLSFMIDWALPIGTALQAMSSTYGMTFLDGYVSTMYEQNYDIDISTCLKTGYYGRRATIAPYTHTWQFQRSPVSTGLPGIPSPQPPLRSSSEFGKVVTALAVSAQRWAK